MKLAENKLIYGALLLTLVACEKALPLAAEEKEETATGSTSSDVPEDSTGGTGSVKVEFKTSAGGMSLLQDAPDEPVASPPAEPVAEAPASLDVAEGVKVSMARFNIGMLKLKAKKDLDVEEHEEEKASIEEDKEHAEDLGYQDVEDDADKDEIAPPDEEGDESKDDQEAGSGEDPTGPEALLTDDGDAPDAMPPQEWEEEHRQTVAGDRERFKEKEHEYEEREKARDGMTRILGLIYDAVAGVFEDDQPAIEVADGSYRRIEFKLRRNLTADATDPLLGNVFVVKGTVKVADVDVPFEFTDHRAMNFRIRGDKGFAVAAAAENPLTVVFDLNKWFKDVDLTVAVASEDGVIRIGRGDNREIFHQLRRNMKSSTRCGRDHDGDGKLADDEAVGSGEITADDED